MCVLPLTSLEPWPATFSFLKRKAKLWAQAQDGSKFLLPGPNTYKQWFFFFKSPILQPVIIWLHPNQSPTSHPHNDKRAEMTISGVWHSTTAQRFFLFSRLLSGWMFPLPSDFLSDPPSSPAQFITGQGRNGCKRTEQQLKKDELDLAGWNWGGSWQIQLTGNLQKLKTASKTQKRSFCKIQNAMSITF